jgi:signal transduction histidine kinase
VYVAAPAITSCLLCGARWVHDAGERNGVEHRERQLALGDVTRAVEQERNRLAAELHDGPIQRVTGLGMRAYLGLQELRAGHDGEAARNFEEIEVGLGREVRALRALVTQLRPPVLSERGLVDALRDHARSIAYERGVVTVVAGSIDPRMSEEIETGLYRIAQEALTNAYRHSGAGRIDVSVEEAGPGIRLTVRDDGTGFDATTLFSHDGGRHYGLLSMRERAAVLRGSLTITSGAGEGTTVVADVPLETSSR